MLKSKITKAIYDTLNDVIKAEYKADGDNYVLDTDDAKELRDTLTTVRGELQTAKDSAKALKTENDTLKAAGGNFATLEESYKSKITKLETDLEGERGAHQKTRENFTLGAKAKELAAKHFTVPDLISEKILARMDLDPRDHTTIRYKDAAGKVSALSEADVMKEFVDNPSYKSIVIANRASGGAGNAANPGGAGNNPFTPPTNSDGKAKLLSQMTPAELVAYNAAKKEAAGTSA